MLNVSPRFGISIETSIGEAKSPYLLLSSEPIPATPASVSGILDDLIIDMGKAHLPKRIFNCKALLDKWRRPIATKPAQEIRFSTRVGGQDFTHKLTYDGNLNRLIYERSWEEVINWGRSFGGERKVIQTTILTVQRADIEKWLKEVQQGTTDASRIEHLLKSFDTVTRRTVRLKPLSPELCLAH